MTAPSLALHRPADPRPAAVSATLAAAAAPRLTVHVGYSRAVLACLRQHGVDPAHVCDAAVLRRIAQGDAGAGFPFDDFRNVLDAARDALADPALPITAAEFAQTWDVGVVGFALMTCATVADVGDLFVRFQRLLSNVYQVKCLKDVDGFEMRLVPASDVRCADLAGLMMGSWAWRTRWFTDRPDLRFDAWFEGPAPADASAYARCFGGTVRFGQPVTAMRGAAGVLSLPVRQHDPLVHGVLREQAAAEMARLDGDAVGLLPTLRRRLRDRLGAGPLTLDALAADLDIAPRTLQQRLEAQGLTFRALLDGVRERKAKQHLLDGRLTVSEIALVLGFANQSAFQHAFKRWTARSPGQWRREQQAA